MKVNVERELHSRSSLPVTAVTSGIKSIFQSTRTQALLLLIGIIAIAATSHTALGVMIGTWRNSPELSHVPLIPLVASFIAWQ